VFKDLYLSNGYGAQTLLREFRNKGWKLESINSLLKRSCQTGTVAGRIRHVAVEDLCSVRRTGQKGTDQLVRFCVKLAFPVQLCTG